jgi:hypothetical protein
MMLPGNRPPTPPMPVIAPMPLPITVAPTAIADSSSTHADYNLHPLAVRSLDHYLEHDVEDERFHVS